MTRTYLENFDKTGETEHAKFYEVIDDGQSVTFRWGSVRDYDVQAPSRTKVATVSSDPAERVRIAEAQIAAKVRKGYVRVRRVEDGKVEAINEKPEDFGDFRKFGVEVETHTDIPMDTIVKLLKERGLNVNDRRASYFHSSGTHWDIKRDGSCGYEFASPILSQPNDAKMAVSIIQRMAPNAVNEACGLHVTVDVSDFSDTSLRWLIINYLWCQDWFYSQCEDSRATNKYCKKNPVGNLARIMALKPSQIDKVADLAGGWRSHEDRYHGFNLTRLFSHKIVEFRMMESNVDPRRVGDWIRRCVGFVEGSKLFNRYTSRPTEADFERDLSFGYVDPIH